MRELETKRREIDALKQRAGDVPRAPEKRFALREGRLLELGDDGTPRASPKTEDVAGRLAELEAFRRRVVRRGPIKEIAFEGRRRRAGGAWDAAALRMGKANRDDRVVFRITDTASAFKTTSPILQELSNRIGCYGDRQLGEDFSRSSGKEYADHAAGGRRFSLRWLLGLGLDADAKRARGFQKSARSANKEHALEKALRKMRDDWDGVAF